MADYGYYVGPGGGKPVRMAHPLPEPIAEQLMKGYLTRVDPPGATLEDPTPEEGAPEEAPAASALKAEWVGYAVRVHGAKPDDAEAMTKADLIDKYGPRPE